MKRKIYSIIALLLSVSLLCACAADTSIEKRPQEKETADLKERREEEEESPAEKENREDAGKQEQEPAISFPVGEGQRPQMIDWGMMADVTVTPNVTPYEIAADLSNVENLEQFYFEDSVKEKLAENGFVVLGAADWEFYEIYETNRYGQIPNFVTVDSLMHTYHLYFAYLLKGIEKKQLSDALMQLSERMMTDSMEQYEIGRAHV